jgi:hypothetical protein
MAEPRPAAALPMPPERPLTAEWPLSEEWPLTAKVRLSAAGWDRAYAGDGGLDGDGLAFGHQMLEQCARGGGGQLGGDLVGFDGRQWLALADLVTDLLQPLPERPLDQRVRQPGHANDGLGHASGLNQALD